MEQADLPVIVRCDGNFPWAIPMLMLMGIVVVFGPTYDMTID